MQNKTINMQNKITNHLTKNGKKNKSESILFDFTKKLQKHSKKQIKQILQIAIINSSPIFRINKLMKNKKKKKKIREFPIFINHNPLRLSKGIRFILLNTKKFSKKTSYNLLNEVMLALKNEGSAIRFKESLQKTALLQKSYLLYYRW